MVQNQELRGKLREVSWGAQGQLPTANHFVVILARTIKDTKYDSEYVKHQMLDVKGFPPELFDKNKSPIQIVSRTGPPPSPPIE